MVCVCAYSCIFRQSATCTLVTHSQKRSLLFCFTAFALFPWRRACHWTWSSPRFSQSGSEAIAMNPISPVPGLRLQTHVAMAGLFLFLSSSSFGSGGGGLEGESTLRSSRSQRSHPLRFLAQQPPRAGLIGSVLPHPGWAILLILFHSITTLVCFYYVLIFISIAILIYFCFFNIFLSI